MSKCKTAVSGQCEKVNPASSDVLAGRLDELKQLFPETVRDGQIDFDRLKKMLDGSLIGDDEGERYGLSWAGKNDCFRHIQEPTTATLKPVRKESIDFDTTKNLFIEGDNLQVLKVLQKSYYGAVKMIYIDPPYNTGNDSFIYPDRFAESQQAYLKRIGDKDAEGNLIKDGFWRKNSRDTGHFHSNWLSMMYPRLFLARNLLRQDGVIFASIDDNEVHNLRMIMNEIFGEENFIGMFARRTKSGGGSASDFFAIEHDYVIAFARNRDALPPLYIPHDPDYAKRFNEEDEKGRYFWDTMARSSTKTRPYKIEAPDGQLLRGHWFRSEERFKEDLKTGEVRIIKKEDGKWSVQFKQRMGEGRKLRSLMDEKDFRSETAELEELGIEGFYHPKPVYLLKELVKVATLDDGIILDFFAGSCTTAHAVMKLNADDGGNRKFICVQLPEPCEEDSEALKAGFKTIADIGKERIRQAAKKIRQEADEFIKSHKKTPGLFEDENLKAKIKNLKSLDLGFKVFKLEESNFKEWRSDVKTAETLERQMFEFIDNVKPSANKEHILFELILKSGLDLNVPVEERKIDGSVYYRIDEGKLIISLADKITKKLVDAILKEKPEKALCLDRAFENNDQLKTNTILQMEAAKIEFKVI